MNDLQRAILDTVKRLDEICKKYEIEYSIMGGTALGAIRHGGFIPWDDDIDVFMTPDSFEKFRTAVEMEGGDYYIDTVGLSDVYTEYAKFKKKNTTLIEKVHLNKDIKHNLFVDIMLLRKLPNSKFCRKLTYHMSRAVSFLTISETEWQPKTKFQKFAKKLAKILPRKRLAKFLLKKIHKNERITDFTHYCYFMSRVKYEQGVFSKEIFSEIEQIKFEDTTLLAPKKITEYLKIRYGDYMTLPPEDKRVGEHGFFVDTTKDYTEYINDFRAKYAILSFRREQSELVKEMFSQNGIVYEVGKAYLSGGEPIHIDDLIYPLTAVHVRENADIVEVRNILSKLKIGYVVTFDIDGALNINSAKKLVKSIQKHTVTTVNIDILKQKLHGKL